MKDKAVAELVLLVAQMVEQTDRFSPKCVVALCTPEAKAGRAAMYELKKRLGAEHPVTK